MDLAKIYLVKYVHLQARNTGAFHGDRLQGTEVRVGNKDYADGKLQKFDKAYKSEKYILNYRKNVCPMVLLLTAEALGGN